MGNHRADPRDTGRETSQTPTVYVGRRVARPVDAAPAVVLDNETGTAETATHYFGQSDVAAEPPLRPAVPGRRRAVKHAGGSLFKSVRSAPVLLGVAALTVAVGGALTTTGPQLTATAAAVARPATAAYHISPASALSGSSGEASVNALRGRSVSRDSSREALQQASDSELVEAAEAQAKEYNAALGQLAAKAQVQADQIAENLWIAPLSPVVLTARFGDYGLWASYHTGLDFNGNSGDPIKAIANGVVTFAGYDGSYGNKTVVTLDDGTEIWFCHQTSQYVSEGDSVRAGEVIGTVGATGNVTGSHLHLEVRPGGGDPVDPYAAMVVHGVILPP